MKLFKVDTTKWEVREVTGEPYPGVDCEGSKCFVNSHFENELDAYQELRNQAEAYVKLSATRIEDAKQELAKTEKYGSDAVCAMAKVLKFISDKKVNDG